MNNYIFQTAEQRMKQRSKGRGGSRATVVSDMACVWTPQSGWATRVLLEIFIFAESFPLSELQ